MGVAPVLSDEQKLILRIWGQGGNRRDVARALEVRESAAELYEDAVLDTLGPASALSPSAGHSNSS